MDELAWLSATEVARRVRSGELRSRDALEAMLDRIERVGGPLNAVVTLDAERARREADAADAAIRSGNARGPLHGVCMTVKDSFETAGMRTTSGAPELADHVPERDSDPVARMRAAGAVIVGKTNLPVYAGDCQSYNEVFGTTNNPWDVTRTPGGSSGGAAAALAAGLTPIEVGSDIGGSIRGPASTCGVAGHKPSYGLVSARAGPPGTLTQADLAVAGPMARSVDDLELGLDILAGPDEWHRPAYRIDLPPARHESLDGFRVAAWFRESEAPIDDEVAALLEQAAKALAEGGARVDFEARPALTFEKAIDTFERLLAAALAGEIPRQGIESAAAVAGDDPVPRALRARALRHREWLSLNERRLQLRQRWHEFFKDHDAVLLPVLPTAAIPHDHSQPAAERTLEVNGQRRPYFDQTLWVGLTGVVFLPATVVPVGVTSEGLPVGIQIAGPFLEDRTTLALARHLERILGGFQRPPGY
ncbi:MAG: amidase [Deltaproteobacteria bacterium]|nr:amidase [Deltaproteobacteria bacterium]